MPPIGGIFWKEEEFSMKTETLLKRQLDLVLAGLMPDNRRVVQVILHTGLRVGDVLTLRLDQIGRQFVVRQQKTGKPIRVGLPDWLSQEIREAALSGGTTPWAFPSSTDRQRHRTRQTVWKDLKRLQRSLHLGINLGTHSMRKEYAVDLMSRYGDIEAVRRALGHDRATTTMVYAMADQLTKSALSRRRTRAHKARAGRLHEVSG